MPAKANIPGRAVNAPILRAPTANRVNPDNIRPNPVSKSKRNPTKPRRKCPANLYSRQSIFSYIRMT